jgi:AraC family transcriptional regulator
MIVREWASQEAKRHNMLAAMMTQLDILLGRTYEQGLLSAAERVVREVERRIEEGYAKTITISTIASDLGVSHSYLRAQFSQLRGRAPMAYLQTVRVQHALALIRSSDTCLEIIAELCGYDSASHLSRNVRHATGRSPGAFRSK